MLLRHGKIYDPKVQMPHLNMDSKDQATSLPSPSLLKRPAIKLLPHKPSLKLFTGDETYTATQFIKSCEDIMYNSYITTDDEKI